MGRKNKRKKSEYRRRLGFNPMKYIGSGARIQSTINPAPVALIIPAPTDTVPPAPIPQVTSAERAPHRGDIWFADLIGCPGTCVQKGVRPVLVVSNDAGNTHSGILNVLPLTSHLKKPYLPCHTLLEPGNVADSRYRFVDSMVQEEQITTIGRLQLISYVGRVEDAEFLNQITRAICAQLALQ